MFETSIKFLQWLIMQIFLQIIKHKISWASPVYFMRFGMNGETLKNVFTLSQLIDSSLDDNNDPNIFTINIDGGNYKVPIRSTQNL